ncbi:MAG: 1-phosphofructokinase family hexose kinase [Sumerlaeia bacterium]
MQQSILTLTLNPAIDKSVEVDHVVDEKKLRCGKPRFEAGGGGLNVSRAILQLGGTSKTVYTSGGPTGQLLANLLEEAGLDKHRIDIHGLTRENLTVLETSTNRQFRFNTPGAEMTREELDHAIAAVLGREEGADKPDFLVASGSLPPGVPAGFYAEMSRRAADEGIKVIVDTSGEALRRVSESGRCYLLKPNFAELQTLVGRELEDDDAIVKAARDLIGKGVSEIIIVSLGSAGALAVSHDLCERVPAPTVQIRSRVGAGDSTVAGFVLALARGKDLHHAVRFGVAAGAACVMTPGTELCRREDTEHLYEQLLNTERQRT